MTNETSQIHADVSPHYLPLSSAPCVEAMYTNYSPVFRVCQFLRGPGRRPPGIPCGSVVVCPFADGHAQ